VFRDSEDALQQMSPLRKKEFFSIL